MECHSGTGERVGHRGLIDERQCVFALDTFEHIFHVSVEVCLLDVSHKHRGMAVGGGDGERLAGEPTILHSMCDEFIVSMIHQCFGILEERHLLEALLLQRIKILLMGSTDIGEYTDIGLDDMPQGSHFTRHADARLEECDFRTLVEQPHRQRNAHLRVVTAWRPRDHHLGREQLEEPLFHDGFSIAACNTHHRDIESVAVTFGQPLQCHQRVLHLQEIGVGIERRPLLGHLLHHEVAHATRIQVVDILVAIVA